MDSTARLVLRTQRLTLEPIGPEDCDDLYEAVVSQVSVMRWLASGQPGTHAEAVSMCRDHAAHWSQHGYGDFAVRDTSTRDFLGRVGLRNRPEFGVDLGFAMRPEWEGQGIASEAGRACLDLAFRHLGLPSVHAFVVPDNARSIALLTRLGAREVGTVVSSGRYCLRFRFETPDADSDLSDVGSG